MAVALESESNSPCSGQAACGQALCNLLQRDSALNSQETEGKVRRNGWCQHQGAAKGRVLEEDTDLLGLSRHLWL